MHDQELEAALEQQQDLVESSLVAVFEAYDAARAENIKQPVILVVDCEDEVGEAIAKAWLGADAVEDAIAERVLDDETTVFTAAFAWRDCQRELPDLFPYLAPVFDGPSPEDGILVIGVTCGGASALTAPFDARPE